MSALLIGTVRGRRGDRHLVRTTTGAEEVVRLVTPDDRPIPVGIDIIGRLSTDGEIRIVDDIAADVIRRGARITPIGRPDATARLLGAVLAESGMGVIRPGTAGTIERTPSAVDPDIDFAIEALGPLADRVGVAFNIIDPTSLASAPWDDQRLTDELLPADAEADGEALRDLKSLIARGLPPSCRTTVHSSGTRSLDFVLPFSPFMVGQDAARDLAGARSDEVCLASMTTSEFRRFSILRECMKGLSHRYLPRAGRHRMDAFADVAAVLVMRASSGSSSALLSLRRLREAGLSRWLEEPWRSPPPATHTALGMIERGMGVPALESTDPDVLLAAAARLAFAAPATDTEAEKLARTARHDRVIAAMGDSSSVVANVIDRYEVSLERLLDEMTDTALTRFAEYSAHRVPRRFDGTIDEILRARGVANWVDQEIGSIEDDFQASTAHSL